ncbi:MAG: hypothetical protein IGS48_16665 [Oscillatoriales cyanobacterium C42_A2020_001]|nr:hypothetical protein [Leptolyngbyaceae cyanobacterium C42_A2020_001]
MFNLFRRNPDSRLQASTASTEYKGDSLNQSMTDIAVQLINGQGGPEWRGYFIDLFQHEPRFLKDVSPEYREALITLLNQHKRGFVSS